MVLTGRALLCLSLLAWEAQALQQSYHSWKGKPGSIGNFRLESSVLEPAGAGTVTVAVETIGLNFADVWTCLGLYKAAPKDGVVPGLEFCGIVTDVGEGSRDSDLDVGTRVMGFTRFGAFATHVNVPRGFVRPLPSGWTPTEGAAFVVQGLTSWHALDMANLRSRIEAGRPPVVLVHSAAGGVGLAAVDQVLKMGGQVVGTVSSEGKAEFLLERCGLPRDQIVVRPSGASRTALSGLFAEAAKHARGRLAGGAGTMNVASKAAVQGVPLEDAAESVMSEADIILDGIGGACLGASIDMLASEGRIVHFGGSTFSSRSDSPNWLHIVPRWLSRPRVDPGALVSRSQGILGFNLIFLTDQVDMLNRELDELLAISPAKPHVGRCFNFQDAPDALRYLQSGASVGKVVLEITDTPPQDS